MEKSDFLQKITEIQLKLVLLEKQQEKLMQKIIETNLEYVKYNRKFLENEIVNAFNTETKRNFLVEARYSRVSLEGEIYYDYFETEGNNKGGVLLNHWNFIFEKIIR